MANISCSEYVGKEKNCLKIMTKKKFKNSIRQRKQDFRRHVLLKSLNQKFVNDEEPCVVISQCVSQLEELQYTQQQRNFFEKDSGQSSINTRHLRPNHAADQLSAVQQQQSSHQENVDEPDINDLLSERFPDIWKRQSFQADSEFLQNDKACPSLMCAVESQPQMLRSAEKKMAIPDAVDDQEFAELDKVNIFNSFHQRDDSTTIDVDLFDCALSPVKEPSEPCKSAMEPSANAQGNMSCDKVVPHDPFIGHFFKKEDTGSFFRTADELSSHSCNRIKKSSVNAENDMFHDHLQSDPFVGHLLSDDRTEPIYDEAKELDAFF